MANDLKCPNCGHQVPLEVPSDSLRQLATAELESGCSDPGEVADTVLDRFLPPAASSFLRPPVRQFASRLQRQKVRDAEKTVLGSTDSWLKREQQARAKALAFTFSLGDGTRVAWGVATIEQHEQRIALLERQQDNVQRTIDRHRLAIQQIRKTPGASCLNDVAEQLPSAEEDA